MKHAQYYRNIANGIARIAQAVKLCDLAPTLAGSVFTVRFSKEWSEPMHYQADTSYAPLSKDTQYNFTLKLDNVDQETIDQLRELTKPNDDPFNYRDINLN